MPFSSQVLEFVAKPVSELDSVERAAWSMLLDQHPHNQHAFLSLTYATAVAALDSSVVVLVAYAGQQPLAFMPLQRRPDAAGRLGAYEPVGGVMSDYFGLIAAPEFKLDIAAALKQCGLPLVVFTHLDVSQLAYGLTGEQPRTGLQTIIDEPAEAFWARLRQTDKKFVGDTERRERKLAAEHGALHFELESSNPDDDLAALIALKCAQYERTDKAQAPLFARRNVDLLFRLLSERSPECCGILSTLKAEGRLVAAHFGLRCHDKLHYWFPVYDPVYAQYAPGRILFRHVLEAIAGQGVRIIDRGEGDTQAKRDFSNHEHSFYRGLWSAGGVRSVPARFALSLQWRFLNH